MTQKQLIHLGNFPLRISTEAARRVFRLMIADGWSAFNYGNGGCDGFAPNFPLIRWLLVTSGAVLPIIFSCLDYSTWI